MKKPGRVLSEEQKIVFNAIDRVLYAVPVSIRSIPAAKMWMFQFEQIIYTSVRGSEYFYNADTLRDYIGNGEFPELAMLGVDPDYVKRCLNATGVAALRCQ